MQRVEAERKLRRIEDHKIRQQQAFPTTNRSLPEALVKREEELREVLEQAKKAGSRTRTRR